MVKFWKWLINFSNKRLSSRKHRDIRCPKCKMTFTKAGGVKVKNLEDGFIVQCANCETTSTWKTGLYACPHLIAMKAGNKKK